MTKTAGPSKHIAKAIGPRQVGGRYLCGYWQNEYTVLAIDTAPTETWMSWSITVQNADGSVKTHCTAWDPRKDKVIAQPAADACRHCGARGHTAADAERATLTKVTAR